MSVQKKKKPYTQYTQQEMQQVGEKKWDDQRLTDFMRQIAKGIKDQADDPLEDAEENIEEVEESEAEEIEMDEDEYEESISSIDDAMHNE